MARKAKKRLHPMPPLSFVDKLIYWTIFVLLCAAYVALMFGPFYLRYKIAFSDAAVIAVEGHASICWFIVPWITFFLMTFILWLMPYQKRIPIFGRRNFKYGPPAWPKVYPLFMKNKPHVWVSERKKKEQKQKVVILLVVLLVSFIPYPWSWYGRDCLMDDGSIVQYNMFNSQTHEFTSDSIADVKIETYDYRTRKSIKQHWGVRMMFETEKGKEYTFDHHDFRSDSHNSHWLEWMLMVRKCYDPGIVHYDGLDDLDAVIADRELSQEEVQMLYQLFELI